LLETSFVRGYSSTVPVPVLVGETKDDNGNGNGSLIPLPMAVATNLLLSSFGSLTVHFFGEDCGYNVIVEQASLGHSYLHR
jgi:hypothetical protein